MHCNLHSMLTIELQYDVSKSFHIILTFSVNSEHGLEFAYTHHVVEMSKAGTVCSVFVRVITDGME